MADNVIANPGSGGATFLSEDVGGGVQAPISKVAFGDHGVVSDVSATNPLPVAIGTGSPVTVTAIDPLPVIIGTSSVVTVSAVSLPLPTGAATDASSQEILSALGTPLQAGGNVVVTSSALPIGAATNAELVTINTTLGAPAQDGVDGTGIVPPTGGSGIRGWLSGIYKAVTGVLNVSVTNGAVDNTLIDSGTISSNETTSAYNTTGYNVLSFQLAGDWAATVQFIGSNDGTNYIPLLSTDVNEGDVSDVVYSVGIYAINVTTKFIQMTVAGLDGSISYTVLGKTVNAVDASQLIATAMDPTNGTSLNVNVAGINKDSQSSLIVSDAPNLIQISSIVGQNIIIDTQGYASLHITTQAYAGNVTCSNDRVTWSALSGSPIVLGALVSAIAANTGYTFPCIARYIRLASTTAGTAQAYLRSQQWEVYTSSQGVNISQINGTAPVNAGVAGTLAVGGNIAVGVAQTNNPLVVGGVDAGGLTRRLETDTNGRLVIAGINQTNIPTGVGVMPQAATSNGLNAIASIDSAMFEGQSQIELLAQILAELKIISFYMFGQTTGVSITPQDDPITLRVNPNDLN